MGRKKKIPDCSILQLKNLLRVLGLLKGKSEVPIMTYSSHEIWLLHHLLDLIANNSSHSTSVLPPLTYLLCMECARHSVIPGVCTMYFPSLGNTLQRLLLNFSPKSSMRLYLDTYANLQTVSPSLSEAPFLLSVFPPYTI